MQSPPARAMADYLLKDHKPPARQGKARLRGLERNNYLKTIISVYTLPEAGTSRDTAGQTGVNVAENCCKFSIFINPQSPRAGVDARAPRMYVVQSFCTSL
jgi:hypothetical protein